MKRFLLTILMLFFSGTLAADKSFRKLLNSRKLISVSCTGHDACKNKIWNGNYDIKCGASNSERTCKSTTLNCGEGGYCTIKTQGSGHDAYQNSIVHAENSQSFKLTCAASGFRDCKDITIWCPQKAGTVCECNSCPNTVTMNCVSGISCTSTGSAKVENVQPADLTPQATWIKDINHEGQRPKCSSDIKIQKDGKNYKWDTLENCKKACINEKTGKCNIISRYGETFKTDNDLYHCWFYKCQDPSNLTWIQQTAWGNGASTSNSYILPIRHFIEEPIICTINKTIYNYQNITNYIDAAQPLVELCINSRILYPDLPKKNNPSFQKKSWDTGCNKKKETLNECYNACNSPKGCCGVTCQSNSCSGGGCCAASKNICKKACDYYFSPESYKIITNYINKTRFINITNYINKTIYNNKWINKTRYINITNDIINYINKTIYNNKWINKTRYINITNDIINYINKTRYYDKWINKTIYINITNGIINYINKTRYYDKWINKTKYINITKIIEIPVYENKTNYLSVDKNNDIPNTDNNIIIKRNNNKNTTCEENNIMNTFYRYGFFFTSGLSILLIFIWLCCIKEFCKFNNKNNHVERNRRDIENIIPPLANVAPIARPVPDYDSLKVNTTMIEMNATSIIEEGVKTPGGTTIRRRSVQI